MASLGLSFSDPPDLEPVLPLSDYLVGRGYGLDRVEKVSRLLEVVELARRFAREAGFGAYLAAKSQDYDALVQAVRGRVAPGIPAALEVYFGSRKDGYLVVVSGLVGKHAYGPRLSDGDWTCLVTIMSPDATIDASAIRTILPHEWGHSFVKPAIENSRELAGRYAYLYPAVRTAMTKQNYGNLERRARGACPAGCHGEDRPAQRRSGDRRAHAPAGGRTRPSGTSPRCTTAGPSTSRTANGIRPSRTSSRSS